MLNMVITVAKLSLFLCVYTTRTKINLVSEIIKYFTNPHQPGIRILRRGANNYGRIWFNKLKLKSQSKSPFGLRTLQRSLKELNFQLITVLVKNIKIISAASLYNRISLRNLDPINCELSSYRKGRLLALTGEMLTSCKKYKVFSLICVIFIYQCLSKHLVIKLLILSYLILH